MQMNAWVWIILHGSSAGFRFPIIVNIKMHGRQPDASSDHVNYMVPVRGAGPSLSANHQQEDDDEVTKDWCDAVVRCFQVYVSTLLLHIVYDILDNWLYNICTKKTMIY